MKVKSYKACDFCRYRKRKCVTSVKNSVRCDFCTELDIPCFKSLRNPSVKLRNRTRKLAASVLNYTDIVEIDETISSLYPTDIFRFTPFVTLLRKNHSLCGQLISIAHSLLSNSDGDITTQLSQQALTVLSESDMDYDLAETSLLLLCRLQFPTSIVNNVFSCLLSESSLSELPLPVAAGLIATNTWLHYLNITDYDLGDLLEQFLILEKLKYQLDDTFARQYLILTSLLLKMQILEQHGSIESHGITWINIEYEFLLVPLHVPSDLIDLRDDIPGNPFGRILHIMVNTINFDFYLRIIKDPNLQRHMQLRPIPGVFHFMLAMAKTAFLYGNNVTEKWNLLVQCRAKLVPMVLELYEISDLENCKEVLSLWTDSDFAELHETVDNIIGDPPWMIEKHSGYSVFWVFRDMRSLHVEGMIHNQNSTDFAVC